MARTMDVWIEGSLPNCRRSLVHTDKSAYLEVIAQELLEYILIRLPIKSILRSKATCKRWRSLIQSPSFINSHRRQHRLDHQDRRLSSDLFRHPDCPMYACTNLSNHTDQSEAMFDLGWIPRVFFTRWIPLLDNSELFICTPYTGVFGPIYNQWNPRHTSYTHVLGPLNNGIHSVIHMQARRSGVSVAISLCNLATRDYAFLKPYRASANALMSSKPSKLHYGFGSVHNEDGLVVDYKVVLIHLTGEDRHSSCRGFLSFVYSLRRRTWNKIADVTYGKRYSVLHNQRIARLLNEKGEADSPRQIMSYSLVQCPQLFLNGSWHWLDVFSPYVRVLSFNVDKEVFGWIGGPPQEVVGVIEEPPRPQNYTHHSTTKLGMLLLNDHLVVMYLSRVGNLPCAYWFDVWMMKYYGVEESWTKIYSFNAAFGGCFTRLVGLSYTTNDDQSSSDHASNINIEKILFRDATSKRFVSWNGYEFTMHGSYKDNEVSWNTLGVSSYIETLEPLSLS